MPEDIPTVFIVDDDLSVRKSLSLLLESAGYRVKVFGSAKHFLESEDGTSGNNCLVLDIRMPGISGLDLQEELSAREYTLPIVFITGHGDIPMSVRAMKKGAIDFISKPFDDDQIIRAVEEALLKGRKDHSTHKTKQQVLKRLKTLTARENETLTYIITGMLNKQIAGELNISERTVKAHKKKVYEKMGVNSIAELVRLAEKAGINPADVSF